LGGAVAAREESKPTPVDPRTVVDPENHLYAPLFVPLPKRAMPR